jgi:hypothetical protein
VHGDRTAEKKPRARKRLCSRGGGLVAYVVWNARMGPKPRAYILKALDELRKGNLVDAKGATVANQESARAEALRRLREDIRESRLSIRRA